LHLSSDAPYVAPVATTMTPTSPAPVWRTSIGQKLLVAGSGVILILFIIGHEIGNLKIYLGVHEINRYADGLRTLAEPLLPRTWLLWGIRGVLIVAFVVHIVTAVQLSLKSRAARRTRYVHPNRVQADPAASTMRWGGLAILLFLVFHLANLTWGWVHPGFTYVRGDVYENMVHSFNVWWISLIYILAMVALALHIYHGTWSVFQTFGVNNKRWDKRVRVGSTVVALFVLIGNISIPAMVLVGAVT
jgi:succinate dehydrogenase / fumarate reductase, cytochrome b subunit